MRKNLESKGILKISNIGSSIVHIVMSDKNTLAEAMMRFQEYYESPFPEIKGQIFTVGYLKSLGSRSNRGINLYCGGKTLSADWDGYNFPDVVLEPFVKGLFDPLTDFEQDIVEALKYRTDSFYVIATYGENDPEDTLEHEIRHAMFGISDAYRKEVLKAVNDYKKELKSVRSCLSSWGYADDVLDDECHAYMGADHDYFFETFTDDIKTFKLKKIPKLRNRLNKLAKKYKLILGLK